MKTPETVAEVNALVGRTFERDGKRRKVVSVQDAGDRWGALTYNLVWKRPGSKAVRLAWCSTWADWMRKAVEVAE